MAQNSPHPVGDPRYGPGHLKGYSSVLNSTGTFRHTELEHTRFQFGRQHIKLKAICIGVWVYLKGEIANSLREDTRDQQTKTGRACPHLVAHSPLAGYMRAVDTERVARQDESGVRESGHRAER